VYVYVPESHGDHWRGVNVYIPNARINLWPTPRLLYIQASEFITYRAPRRTNSPVLRSFPDLVHPFFVPLVRRTIALYKWWFLRKTTKKGDRRWLLFLDINYTLLYRTERATASPAALLSAVSLRATSTNHRPASAGVHLAPITRSRPYPSKWRGPMNREIGIIALDVVRSFANGKCLELHKSASAFRLYSLYGLGKYFIKRK